MPRFFVVDRLRKLRGGEIIANSKSTRIGPPKIQAHANELVPEGVTSHGEFYLLAANDDRHLDSMYIELLLEYVRKAGHQNRPSRFQSVFATDSLRTAKRFRRDFGKSRDPIWEVKANKFFKADMAWLSLHPNSLLYQSFAFNNYWKGVKCSRNSLFEVLLVPPVTVLRRIE